MATDLVAAFGSDIESINAIGSLAFGATGGVVLGGFEFQGFEVPEHITFGGHQAMTVHKLPGGERIVDLLGPDDTNLEWSGVFLDNDPVGKAQQLDQMRAAGQPLPLVWGTNFYSVIIESFTADTKYSQVPYRISCLVLVNEAEAQSSSQDDLTSVSTSDINTAVTAGPIDAQASLGTAQTTINGLGNIATAGASAQNALLAVNTAQATISSLRATAEISVNGIIANGNVVGAVVGSAADLTTAVAQTGELAQLMQSQGYLGRLSINLGGQPWV